MCFSLIPPLPLLLLARLAGRGFGGARGGEEEGEEEEGGG